MNLTTLFRASILTTVFSLSSFVMSASLDESRDESASTLIEALQHAQLHDLRLRNTTDVPATFNVVSEQTLTLASGERKTIGEITYFNTRSGSYEFKTDLTELVTLASGAEHVVSLDGARFVKDVQNANGQAGFLNWGVENGGIVSSFDTAKLTISSPVTSSFVVVKDLAYQASLYQKYFSPAADMDWLDDFMAQPSGVTDNKRDEEVIVSLTSYPARFQTTWLAIESLLRQEEKPDRVVLNLFEGEFPGRVLPWFIRQQMKRGLEINWCPENFKVFLKVIPTIKRFPDAVTVAVDDDRLYNNLLIKILLSEHKKYPNEIINPGTREYVISDETGVIDYLNCRPDRKLRYNLSSGYSIFEGFSGILLPPHSFDDEIFNMENAAFLTPCNDDVWKQAMAIKNRTKSRGVPLDDFFSIVWPPEIRGTQGEEQALFHTHLSANNFLIYQTLYYYDLLHFINIPIHNDLMCQNCNEKSIFLKLPEIPRLSPLMPKSKLKKCKVCLK